MAWLQCTHYFKKQSKDNLGFAGEATLEVRCVQLKWSQAEVISKKIWN